MGTAKQTPYFFRAKPLFGLDIGMGSLKVVQLDTSEAAPISAAEQSAAAKAKKAHHSQASKTPRPALIGYGVVNFDPKSIVDGVIVDPEAIATAAQKLFEKQLIGDITTRRVAMAIPAYRTFTRSVQLPVLKPRERAEAVHLEAEQYLPMPLEDVYLDYTPISETADGMEVLAVAVPKNIVDSYTELTSLMGLEPMIMETTMNAAGRMFSRDTQSDVASVLIDFGTLSSDISIYDNGVVTTGTVEGGGQVFTNVIQKALNVSGAEANVIKTKYGLDKSKRQAEIQAAFEPTLKKIVKEIQRLMRYHSERYGNERPIQQVITLGGGANIPGLSDYFINELRVAVRACDPWQYVDVNGLQAPNFTDRSMYATAIGLGFVKPTKVFK